MTLWKRINNVFLTPNEANEAEYARTNTRLAEQENQSQESRSGREPEGSPARFRLEVESPLLVHYTGSQLQRNRTQRRLSGNNGTWLIVGADGLPKNIKAQRPVGLGLDDEAVKAVESWKFAPAMKAGSPVPVMINVEVNFRLY